MFCPKGVLEVDKVLWKVKVVKPEDCICCKKCEEMCPDFAIFILDN
jgi:2-oxoglutarate ferredoxin oxidoreductase subunit delta